MKHFIFADSTDGEFHSIFLIPKIKNNRLKRITSCRDLVDKTVVWKNKFKKIFFSNKVLEF